MKAYIISYHDSHDYNTRIKYLEDFFHSNNYDTVVLASDFNHIDKCEYKINRSGTKLIHVSPYSKNISVSRVKSYYGFAKSCSVMIEKDNDIDLVYVLAPPNLLIKELSALKTRKNYKLIIEVGDMWPESMPIPSMIKTIGKPIFEIWRKIRDNNINYSDYIITECDLFKENLVKYGLQVPCRRIYFCKESLYVEGKKSDLSDEIRLCYIGSINNIIDIDYIGNLIKAISNKKKVSVDIIGKGENENRLCEIIDASGGVYTFHGAIYDNNKKYEIISQCHFSLNVMKESVFVGMTMKSLDYFSMGLPVINNIHGDIWEMVEQNKCGINADNPSDAANKILSVSDDNYLQMYNRVVDVFEKNFSINNYNKEMEKVFDFLTLKTKY